MEEIALIQAALRVLNDLARRQNLNPRDIHMLKKNADPDSRALTLDALACEIIQRELSKRPPADSHAPSRFPTR